MIGKLMLGTVQFGLDYGVANKDGQVPYREVLRILERAYRGGIRFLDTAISYGDSEKVLGRALTELGLNGAFQIVTKIRPLPAAAGADEAAKLIRASLDESLDNLRCRSLYGCMFHREEEIRFLPLLREIREQGIVGKYGVSLDSAAGAAAAIHCDIIQLPLNILDCRFEKLRTDAEIFARSVFLQGLLLMDGKDIPAALAPLKDEIARFEPIRRRLGVERMEFCLRYNLSKRRLSRVLIGVNTLEQLDMNIEAAAKGPLPPTVMAEIETMRRPLPERLIRPRLWSRRPGGLSSEGR